MTTGITNTDSGSSSGVLLPNTDKTATQEASKASVSGISSPLAADKDSIANRQQQVTSTEEKAKPSFSEIIQISEKLNQSVQKIQRDLSFTVDDTQGDIVVKVIDRSTQEVIRQIPSEDMLRLSQSFEEVNSLLFNTKA
jgi:flagellar protein FlaG